MIKRAIELSPSNINLNLALIGFIGFCGSELKVELCWIMDNSFESETFSSILLEVFGDKLCCKFCCDRIRASGHYMAREWTSSPFGSSIMSHFG